MHLQAGGCQADDISSRCSIQFLDALHNFVFLFFFFLLSTLAAAVANVCREKSEIRSDIRASLWVVVAAEVEVAVEVVVVEGIGRPEERTRRLR